MSAAERLRRIWRLRPLLLYAFITLIVAGLAYSFWADSAVTRTDKATPRDATTGVITGAEPRWLGPEDSTRAVLLVHGFIGTPQNYNTLPDAIAAQGWRVHAMLLPGHGTSPRDFERTSADQLQAGVLEAARALRAKYPTVVLVGHSMGGALVTLAAAHEPVDGLVLCSPFFGLTTERVLGLKVTAWANILAPALRWVPGRYDGAPVNLPENKDKVLSYQWVPTQAALAAFEIGRRANQPAIASAITMPALLIHSTLDKVTAFNSAEGALARFATQEKSTVTLTKSDHVLFWDYEAPETEAAVLKFLSRWDAVPAAS